MAKPRLASHTSRDRLVFKEPGVHSSDDEEDGCDVGSEDGTSSNSSSHKHTSFDRHLVLVGKFEILRSHLFYVMIFKTFETLMHIILIKCK